LAVPPLLDRVATTFHARSESTIKGIDDFLLLRYRLLVLGVALLSCLSTADHCTGDRPDSRTLARIARDRANGGASRRPAGGAA
jgi:hypothetical protein